MPRWSLAAVFAGLAGGVVVAVPPAAQQQAQTEAPKDAVGAANRVQVEKGLKVELWASEPLLANPVSFAFDNQGACYVAETTRFGNGVPDTRSYLQWLDDDIGSRTVADRLKMYERFKYTGYEEFSDQVRRVVDTKGAGRADMSTVFAGGFNKLKDGLAAGVLARDGGVYFTCIPSLYHLKDTDNDGVADVTKELSTGYGVRAQFLGHDLHGLRMGPDGKLYFSIGDRGFSVTTKEGKPLAVTDSGSVLRCDPDGANLEVIHTGLRNPQELAFDDFGNLFTWDNNSDSGDRARWVHVVEGGDSGWRCGYQYGTHMHHAGVPQGNRGPWNAENIWHVPGPETTPPAYIVPALKHFGNGPSGITAYPGVGLDDKYKNHFFACDFTANPGNSQVWSLALKPKGASFEVVDLQGFAKSTVPTDCEFGPDGAFYILDWVGGWSPPGKGRIFRVTDPKAMANPAVAESKKLLAEGFKKTSDADLAKLLGHVHRGVRYEAQFELAGRPSGAGIFRRVLDESKDKLARLHAVWGGAGSFDYAVLDKLATDPDPDIRVAFIRSAGRLAAWKYGIGPFIINNYIALSTRLMADPDPRVRAAAAVQYGAWSAKATHVAGERPDQSRPRLNPLFLLLNANNDADAYLRHAAVEGLVRATGSANDLFNAWKLGGEKLNTPAVRMGVVLALRKLQGEQLVAFLSDSEPKIVAEVARAIYDEQVMKALPALAAMAATPNLPDPVAYRAVAANYKLGTPDAAARVAAVAARSSEAGHVREFALKLLAEWNQQNRRDPVTGLRQSLEWRDPKVARDAVRPALKSLFTGPDGVRKEAAAATARLGVVEVGPFMKALVLDANQPASTRAEALYALAEVKGKELPEVTKAALADREPRVRAAARVVGAKADPMAAQTALPALLADAKSDAIEKQAALTAMGTLPESKTVDAALAGLLDAAISGVSQPELKLEVMEAAALRVKTDKLKLHAPLKDKLAALDKADRARESKDNLAGYRDAVAGGDPARGREVFLNNAAVYCQRCHKVDNQGGDVGPALNGIAAKYQRDYLLESIVHPNAKIAEGFQSVIVNTLDGRTVNGVLRVKDAKGITLVTAENKVIVIPADDVESERPDKSAMPDDLHKKLTRRELRDVVEFLASLKEAPRK